jgi:hypothetical protein
MVQARYQRDAQTKHRGSRRSYLNDAEDALIMLAYVSGVLPKDVAADVLTARNEDELDKRIASSVAKGRALGVSLSSKGRP